MGNESLTQNQDVISFFQVLDLMSDEQDNFVLEEVFDALFKEMFAHVSIDSGQWVIKQVDIRVPVYGPA